MPHDRGKLLTGKENRSAHKPIPRFPPRAASFPRLLRRASLQQRGPGCPRRAGYCATALNAAGAAPTDRATGAIKLFAFPDRGKRTNTPSIHPRRAARSPRGTRGSPGAASRSSPRTPAPRAAPARPRTRERVRVDGLQRLQLVALLLAVVGHRGPPPTAMGRPHPDDAAARACVVPAPCRPFLACLARAIGGNAASGLGWAAPAEGGTDGRGEAAHGEQGWLRLLAFTASVPAAQSLQRSAPGRTERTWRAGEILLASPTLLPRPPRSGGHGRAEVRCPCVTQTSDEIVHSWTFFP